MKVLDIRGTKSVRVLNVFSTLCVGMTMLPKYLSGQTSAQGVMDVIAEMPSEDKEKVLRELVEIVPLEQDEIEAVMQFCCDNNGVPFSKVNMKNLTPFEIRDGLVAVLMELAGMKIHTVNEAEKKNSETSRLTQ